MSDGTPSPLSRSRVTSFCRRFAAVLTDCDARLGADMDGYSFIASDLHRLLVAGLPAHCEAFWTLPPQTSFQAPH